MSDPKDQVVEKQIVEDKNMGKLFSALTELNETRNVVDVIEFGDFMPLFQEDSGLAEEEVNALSTQFMQRFDLYENISVTDNNGDELVKLPRLFTPLNPIDKDNTAAVDSYHKDANSDVPKYSSEALSGLVNAFNDANSDKAFIEKVAVISHEYHDLKKNFEDRRASQSPDANVGEATNTESAGDRDMFDPNTDPDMSWE